MMEMRRLSFVLVAAGLILTLVVSCASARPEPGQGVDTYGGVEDLDPHGQAIVYWYPYTRSREELILSMIDEFNRANEWGITVLGQSQASYADLYERIRAGISTSQLPGIAVASQSQVATYARQGVLVALDPYVRSGKWGYTQEELGDFFPAALAADVLPEFSARYGWPHYQSMEVMYYNEDWLAELGYEGPPETWNEFAEMACAAAEQPFSGATGEGDSTGYVYDVNVSWFVTFVFSRGSDIINEAGTGYVFNGKEGLQALTFVKDLRDHGCAVEQTERYGDQGEFGAGRSLFTINSISNLPHYAQAVNEGAGFNWSVNPTPHTTDEPRLNIHGSSQVIFKSTPEEQLAAWLFIEWMSEPEQQATWARGTGYFAVRQSTAEVLTDYFAKNPVYEKAFGFMSHDYGIEAPVTGYDECRNAIVEMLTAVLGGEQAQPQLDAAVGQCSGYLDGAAP